MATFKGFVQAIQARGDGWLEIAILAPHAGNALHNFLIEDLDGNIDDNNRRLAQLGLLRDALARVLPVEIEYRADAEQGDVVEDVTIHPRPAIEDRGRGRRVVGTVIHLGVAEFGPVSASSPYRDESDIATVTLLRDDGGVEQAVIDLQRPDPLTAQAMLFLLQKAHRRRRPVALLIAGTQDDRPQLQRSAAAAGARAAVGAVLACEWLVVPRETLETCYAFIERLGQRYESYEPEDASALSHVVVTYTTAPGQTPEGDVSDNGSFAPVTRTARVHGDSPLLQRLEAALRDRLQVRLGLLEDRIHEVVVVGRLGSAARPVWIEVRRHLQPEPCAEPICDNTPTIRSPDAASLDAIPRAVVWQGEGYFNQGIWRFVLRTASPARLLIDGRPPCGQDEKQQECHCPPGREQGEAAQHHVYLDGVHEVKLVLTGRSCSQPFEMLVYRIR